MDKKLFKSISLCLVLISTICFSHYLDLSNLKALIFAPICILNMVYWAYRYIGE